MVVAVVDVGDVGVLVDELAVGVGMLVSAFEPVGMGVVVVSVVVDVFMVVLTGFVAVRVEVVAAEHERHADGGDDERGDLTW